MCEGTESSRNWKQRPVITQSSPLLVEKHFMLLQHHKRWAIWLGGLLTPKGGLPFSAWHCPTGGIGLVSSQKKLGLLGSPPKAGKSLHSFLHPTMSLVVWFCNQLSSGILWCCHKGMFPRSETAYTFLFPFLFWDLYPPVGFSFLSVWFVRLQNKRDLNICIYGKPPVAYGRRKEFFQQEASASVSGIFVVQFKESEDCKNREGGGFLFCNQSCLTWHLGTGVSQ